MACRVSYCEWRLTGVFSVRTRAGFGEWPVSFQVYGNKYVNRTSANFVEGNRCLHGQGGPHGAALGVRDGASGAPARSGPAHRTRVSAGVGCLGKATAGKTA